MKPRLWFAAPVLVAVWLASNGSSGGSRVAGSAASQSDPTKTPTAQPEARTASKNAAPQTASGAIAPEASRDGAVAPQTARDAVFAATVRPILVSHCAPCHEPGGKMYERLPFDRAETIASHSEGVLKRIKVPDERAAIEKWLAAKGS